MLRITVVSQTPEEVALKVEGWMCGANVGLLEQEGGRYLQEASRLVLDLKEVLSLYEDGVALLQGWQAQGRLQICAWSHHIEDKLQHHGLIPPRKDGLA